MLGPQRQPHSLRQVVAQSKFVAAEFAALTEETGVKTMAKQTIEIDVPDGTIGKIVHTTYHNGREFSLRIAVEDIPPKTKWRPPTKADLLGVDSIPGRVRDCPSQNWEFVEICSVSTRSDYRYMGTNSTPWRFAEIEVPIDEQPPREAWVRYHDGCTDQWGLSYGEEKITHKNNVSKIKVIRMVEVRKPTSESKT